MAETDKVAVHELASVVRVERDDLPWIPAEAGLQGSDHIHLCLRADSSCLGPSRGAVRDGQGPVEIIHRSPSVMTYQVHGQDPGDVQWRVHAGLNGDPATQRSAPGMRDPVETVPLPLPLPGVSRSWQDSS